MMIHFMEYIKYIFLGLAICSLATIANFVSPKAKPVSDLGELEKITGANFCSQKGPTEFHELSSVDIEEKRMREIVLSNFDTKNRSCLDLTDLSRDALSLYQKDVNLLVSSGTIHIGEKSIPVSVSRSRNFDGEAGQFKGTIFVRVPGGPGGSEIFSPISSLSDSDSGAIFIDFFYTGNGFNLLYPSPSFRMAASQLVQFLSNLRSLNPEARVVLIGESLGATIAIAAIEKLTPNAGATKRVVNEVVLLSGPFTNLDEAGKTLRDLFGGGSLSDRAVLYRVRSDGTDYRRYGELRELDWYDVFTKFYEHEEGAVSLYDRIERSDAKIPILLIYGRNDKRIGVELAEHFASTPIASVQIEPIDGMGHQPANYFELHDVLDEIEAFLGRCQTNVAGEGGRC